MLHMNYNCRDYFNALIFIVCLAVSAFPQISSSLRVNTNVKANERLLSDNEGDIQIHTNTHPHTHTDTKLLNYFLTAGEDILFCLFLFTKKKAKVHILKTTLKSKRTQKNNSITAT